MGMGLATTNYICDSYYFNYIHKVLHFSPALFSHVTVDLKKELVLVLNKVYAKFLVFDSDMCACCTQVDLVPPSVAVAWKHYFQSHFPNLHIICFTSFPKNTLEYQQTKGTGDAYNCKISE